MSSSWGSNSSGSSSISDVESPFDVEELVQIGTRCSELRKEKDMLRESQLESVELVRSLELKMNSLSELRLEDERRIQTMEKELLNCYQEIDYLRDEVNFRSKEVDYLTEHVFDLEVKVTESGKLEERVNCLMEDLCRSKSEQLLLLQELERAETELQLSVFSIEKMEESITSLTLESQCEIESMKFDVEALEQALFDAKKVQGESIQERDKLREIVEELRLKSQEAQEYAKSLEKQNEELREDSQDVNLRDKMEDMAKQLRQYEDLVKQLKDEMKEEKLKAKEEAEDLTQEMAELRYNMTCLLEEERKRRACIEQASLQRIANLETQIKRERSTSPLLT